MVAQQPPCALPSAGFSFCLYDDHDEDFEIMTGSLTGRVAVALFGEADGAVVVGGAGGGRRDRGGRGGALRGELLLGPGRRRGYGGGYAAWVGLLTRSIRYKKVTQSGTYFRWPLISQLDEFILGLNNKNNIYTTKK